MNLPAPSDILRALMVRHAKDIERVAKLSPIWRCFDCKQWIPRTELPMRCAQCSAAPLIKSKKIGYRNVKERQDAMVCIRCCDKHVHLYAAIETQALKWWLTAQGKDANAGLVRPN